MSGLNRGIVYNLMRFSLHDGPGIRTTVFLKGCPLDCWWCHNPESRRACPELMYAAGKCIGCGDCRRVCQGGGSSVARGECCTRCGRCASVCAAGARELVGKRLTADEVMREVAKDELFYDESGGGVTFSGGEPLMQPQFLLELLRRCKERSLHTAVDTTGYAPGETLLAAALLTDLFLYDLKLMNDERHRRFTGVSNRVILENLQALSCRHQGIRVRFPLIPGINDDLANVRALGEFVRALPGVSQIDLLPYQRLAVDKYQRLQQEYRLQAIEPPAAEAVEAVAAELKRFGLTVKIGG